jgi:hypothetical protein
MLRIPRLQLHQARLGYRADPPVITELSCQPPSAPTGRYRIKMSMPIRDCGFQPRIFRITYWVPENSQINNLLYNK